MKTILPLLLILILSSSCSSQKKILYLQNQAINTGIPLATGGEIRLQHGDIISINVSSKNPELASIFNIYRSSTSSSTSEELYYTIDNQGNIDFPVLGLIKVENLTKTELAKEIKRRILESGMLSDPVVTIEFQNLFFYTLGEVNTPNSYKIEKERTSVLDAISMSGDLTINGLRDRVFVTRKIADKAITYKLNLTSSDIYNSPAFFIQQNDVIYIEPNKQRSNQSTANGNTIRTVSFWTSLASFLTSMSILILNL